MLFVHPKVYGAFQILPVTLRDEKNYTISEGDQSKFERKHNFPSHVKDPENPSLNFCVPKAQFSKHTSAFLRALPVYFLE